MNPDQKKSLDKLHSRWLIFLQTKNLNGYDHTDLERAHDFFREEMKEPPQNLFCGDCVIAMLEKIFKYGYTPVKESSINDIKIKHEDQPKTIEDLSFQELKKEAKSRGISFQRTTKKAELIRLINGGVEL